MKRTLKLSFFGSSLVSAWWNGAATCCRGILKYLAGTLFRGPFVPERRV